MKKKIRYTDEPLGQLQVVRDFLPPPEKLAFKDIMGHYTSRATLSKGPLPK